MVALTYDAGTARSAEAAAREANTAPRQSWWKRAYDSLVESRMAQARREIRLHLPPKAYARLMRQDTDNKPFGGW
jgi:hypothetical protein